MGESRITASTTASTIASTMDNTVSSRVTTMPRTMRSSRMYLLKTDQRYVQLVAAPYTNRAASSETTIAVTQRHGCRSGTASMAVGATGSALGEGETSRLIVLAGLIDRAVDHRFVDHALRRTPVGGDGL